MPASILVPLYFYLGQRTQQCIESQKCIKNDSSTTLFTHTRKAIIFHKVPQICQVQHYSQQGKRSNNPYEHFIRQIVFWVQICSRIGERHYHEWSVLHILDSTIVQCNSHTGKRK